MRIALLFLIAGLVWTEASAQTADMRALSRRRGYAAYQPKQPAARRRITVERQAFAPPESNGQAEEYERADLKKDDASKQKIHQTGIKIFQEKDEDKVLNFTVDNPEFDRLSQTRQQDVLKRITIKRQGAE